MTNTHTHEGIIWNRQTQKGNPTVSGCVASQRGHSTLTFFRGQDSVEKHVKSARLSDSLMTLSTLKRTHVTMIYKHMSNLCSALNLCGEFTVSSGGSGGEERKTLPLGRKLMDGICYATSAGQASVFKICLQPLLVVKTISKPSYRQTWKSIRPRQTRWTSFTLVGEIQMKLLRW